MLQAGSTTPNPAAEENSTFPEPLLDWRPVNIHMRISWVLFYLVGQIVDTFTSIFMGFSCTSDDGLVNESCKRPTGNTFTARRCHNAGFLETAVPTSDREHYFQTLLAHVMLLVTWEPFSYLFWWSLYWISYHILRLFLSHLNICYTKFFMLNFFFLK